MYIYYCMQYSKIKVSLIKFGFITYPFITMFLEVMRVLQNIRLLDWSSVHKHFLVAYCRC